MLALMGLVAVLAFWALFGSTSADYVGSEKCGQSGCHSANLDAWEETLHGIDFSNWDYHGTPTNKYTYMSDDPDNGTWGGCGSCHVVGEGDTANGGATFDEPWNSTHNLPLGSIGCENCHGPGSGHVDDRAGNPGYMQLGEFAYSLSCAGWSTSGILQEERMGICHDGGRMGGIEDEDVPGYYMSAHAGGIGPSSPKGNPECYHCMAADGFISVTIEGNDAPDEIVLDGEVYLIAGKEVTYGIYCGACHDPHPDAEGEHFQLRAPEEDLCELCHYNTHVFPDTHVRHPTTEFRNGLNGKGVEEIKFMEEVSCPECHMWGTGHRGDPVVVGHSFIPDARGCVACHSMYTNETAQLWIDGIQAQFEDLLAPFGNATTGLIGDVEARKAWAMENGLWSETTNMTYLEGMWNYEYPHQDGSEGVHNPEFMRAMFMSATEKFGMVLADTNKGNVQGTIKWVGGDAIEGAKIIGGNGVTVDTTDADGAYSFYYEAGTRTFIVEDADGKAVGSINAEVTVMQNLTKDVEFEEPKGDGDDDDDETDTMTYVFIGIIVLLIIILIVVAMMGKKE